MVPYFRFHVGNGVGAWSRDHFLQAAILRCFAHSQVLRQIQVDKSGSVESDARKLYVAVCQACEKLVGSLSSMKDMFVFFVRAEVLLDSGKLSSQRSPSSVCQCTCLVVCSRGFVGSLLPYHRINGIS
jgi:hypothetical protein